MPATADGPWRGKHKCSICGFMYGVDPSNGLIRPHRARGPRTDGKSGTVLLDTNCTGGNKTPAKGKNK